MGLQVKGVGIIAMVCKNCGFIACWYAIGDKGNKAKFNGPPTPVKAKSGHDREVCPYCGRRLSDKPEGIYFMTYSKFMKLYDIAGGVRLVVREQRRVAGESLGGVESRLASPAGLSGSALRLVEAEA